MPVNVGHGCVSASRLNPNALIAHLLREDLGRNCRRGWPIGPAVRQANNEQHGNLGHAGRLVVVVVVGKGRRQAREDQQRGGLDGEARDEQGPAAEAVDGEGVDEHDEELQRCLDAVDREGLVARVTAERFIDLVVTVTVSEKKCRGHS